MDDKRRFILRKAEDGVNYKAVLMKFCGDWYESESYKGATPFEAKRGLISSLQTEIYMLERDLDFIMYG